MRNDLHKVVTERERAGDRSYAPNSTYSEGIKSKHYEDEFDRLDQLPRTESMTERLGWDVRSFTDVLGPLKGVLRKACGRKWDDVFSEFNKKFPPTNTQYRHIYEHIEGFVCNKTYLINGKVCERIQTRMYDKYEFQPLEGVGPTMDKYGFMFYVDPTTGILKEVKRKGMGRKKYAAHLEKMRQKDLDSFYRKTKDKEYMKIKGQWYEIAFVKYDAMLLVNYKPHTEFQEQFYQHFGRNMNVKTIRQISSKEKRSLNIP